MVGVGTGAVAGALVGGPIGAVVGAVAGGVIGSNTPSARSRHARRGRSAYRRRAERPVAQRARLAERDATPVRARPSSSEIDLQPKADITGSTTRPRAAGWQDPN